MQPVRADRDAPSSSEPVRVAMVLCAGLGTRLRPLTDERPKPLVPLGDRPLLHHVVERLQRQGLERVVINTHHAAEAFGAPLVASLPLPTVAVHEAVILGTAGGVQNAQPWLGEGDVLVWNGDILADVDLAGLIAAHRSHRPLATLAVAPLGRGPGNVGVDESGRVVRLRSEQFAVPSRAFDFVGIQIISAALRRQLPAVGCLVGDTLLPALRAGGFVRAEAVVARWSDVGTRAAYLDANVAWLAAQGLERWLGPGASVAAEVVARRSVVGAGATVAGRGELCECVIWPGAHAVAPLERAVVTTAGVVAYGEPTSG